MKPTDGQISWFALFVRTKHERIIEKALNDKGYETYVPYRAVERKWADRLKLAHVPLFPNYVFCRFNPADRFPVVSTPDVYSVICLGKTPTPIPEEEIEGVRRVVLSSRNMTETSIIEPGEPVVVVSGPLTGLRGSVIRVRNEWRLVVMVRLLQRGVATEIDREHVKPLCDAEHALPFGGRVMTYPQPVWRSE